MSCGHNRKYGKCPKILNILFHTYADVLLKYLVEQQTSADPDQASPSEAVLSGSALFAYVIMSDT